MPDIGRREEVEPEAILGRMKAYFEGKQPPEVLDTFAEQSPRALLKESLDVVDFVVYLEEELGREIDMNELSQSLLNENFGELAVEVSRMLDES
jgi:acyl carrier protein